MALLLIAEYLFRVDFSEVLTTKLLSIIFNQMKRISQNVLYRIILFNM